MEKKDQKIRARVNPSPHFRAMPELKPSFSVDVFPYKNDIFHCTETLSYDVGDKIEYTYW